MSKSNWFEVSKRDLNRITLVVKADAPSTCDGFYHVFTNPYYTDGTAIICDCKQIAAIMHIVDGKDYMEPIN